MIWTHYGAALPIMLAFAVGGWLLSVVRRNVTLVDSMWGLFFVIALLVYSHITQGEYWLLSRPGLLLCIVSLWGVRLSAYLTWRNRRHLHEDRRYQTIRQNNQPFWIKSLYIVFGLQAVLAWVISLPLFGAVQGDAPLGILDAWGLLLWLIGFLWECVGDYQLARFQAIPVNADKVMDSGLWSLSRHPNYFGECCVWWGYYFIACAAGAAWSLPAPLLMTFLLLKVSGVALLEKDIQERRPGYAAYIKNTSAFIPWFKRT